MTDRDTTTHAGWHETRLAELLARGDAEAAFPASEVAACGACRQELADVLALQREMDALAADEQHGMRAARAFPLDAAPGRAERHLRERMGARVAAPRPLPEPRPGPPRAGRPRRVPAILAGAAAAAVAVVLFALRDPAPPPGASTGAAAGASDASAVKLGDELALVHPVGEVQVFAPFTWDHEPSPSVWYEVEVVGTTPGWSGPPVESGRLREPRWDPPAEELARLPAEIRWRLRVYAGTNARDVLEGASARARLRAP